MSPNIVANDQRAALSAMPAMKAAKAMKAMKQGKAKKAMKAKDMKAKKTAWGGGTLNRQNNRNYYKSDEIDVESLWQLQPDLKN